MLRIISSIQLRIMITPNIDVDKQAFESLQLWTCHYRVFYYIHRTNTLLILMNS